MKNVGNKEEDLLTVQKNIENAAKKVRHQTKGQREKETMSTPETVTVQKYFKLYSKNQAEKTQ